jgi:uncharacterized protein YneF (UPF0154 family)
MLEKKYRFEIAAISISWLAAILIGILAGVFFKRKVNKKIEVAAIPARSDQRTMLHERKPSGGSLDEIIRRIC